MGMIYIVMDFGRPIAASIEYMTALGIATGLRPNDPESCIVSVQLVMSGEVD